MEAFSNAGEVVYEPFNGSGTSILAAEQCGRKCRAVELSPEYVDVSIKRFKQHYPDVAVLLSGTGQTFEEVTKEREQ